MSGIAVPSVSTPLGSFPGAAFGAQQVSGIPGISSACAAAVPGAVLPQAIMAQAFIPQAIVPQATVVPQAAIVPFVAPQVQATAPLQQTVLTPSALSMAGMDAAQLVNTVASVSNFQTLQAISNLQTSRALIDLAMRSLHPAAHRPHGQ